MFHLVYASSATKPFTKPELQELLRKSRDKNEELGLTGMLLYKDGNFMQVLEGEEGVVRKMSAHIEQDSRHRGFLEILKGQSDKRVFPDWSMGFRDLNEQHGDQLAGYIDFLNTPLTGKEFSQDPSRSMKLLLLFKRNM